MTYQDAGEQPKRSRKPSLPSGKTGFLKGQGEDCMNDHTHCWHETGRWQMSDPPRAIDKCCLCGMERSLEVRFVRDEPAGHGPFHPAAPRIWGDK